MFSLKNLLGSHLNILMMVGRDFLASSCVAFARTQWGYVRPSLSLINQRERIILTVNGSLRRATNARLGQNRSWGHEAGASSHGPDNGGS